MPQIKIGSCLFERLAQLGIKTCWGVPGDYELALLDLIGESGIQFSGNANELIASYSADGYARINGAGAFVTTFGPGELSAYCGHAGAYAEYVPVVHIVGYPGVAAMSEKRLMHHSLGTGQFDMYHQMAQQISVDTAVLTDPKTAADTIDRCLNNMLYHSRPVYIGVPVDVSHLQIDGQGLETPLQRKLTRSTEAHERKVLSDIIGRIESSNHPVIIADGLLVRNELSAEADKLAQLTGWPYFTTAMGKGGPNENLPNFGGVYAGAGSLPAIKRAIEKEADLVVWLGSFRTDFNTGEMTDCVDEAKTIDMQRFSTKVGPEVHGVGMERLLKALVAEIATGKLNVTRAGLDVRWEPYPPPEGVLEASGTSQPLTQDFLWHTLSNFFKPGDLVVGETGTSAFGLCASRYPGGCHGYNQTVFGSIGYAGPSSTGAFQAAKESGKLGRGILVTGEGSLQLTPMCFADMLKLDLKPIVFVLNNNGYTVERLIHGKDAFYNSVREWDYEALSRVFGPKHMSKYFGPIKTCEELERLLQDETFQKAECFQLVELILAELDAPQSVRLTTAAIEAFNQKNAATDTGVVTTSS